MSSLQYCNTKISIKNSVVRVHLVLTGCPSCEWDHVLTNATKGVSPCLDGRLHFSLSRLSPAFWVLAELLARPLVSRNCCSSCFSYCSLSRWSRALCADEHRSDTIMPDGRKKPVSDGLFLCLQVRGSRNYFLSLGGDFKSDDI